MQITVTEQPKSEVLIKVEVASEELKQYEEQTARNISQQVEIKGYRKGQAPKLAVLTAVGPERFNEELLRVALPMTYAKAVQEKELRVVSRPEVKIITNDPLVYEARVALLPKVNLGKIENVTIPKKEIIVDDKELEALLEQLKKYRATFTPIDRAIQKGDRVEIDFVGTDAEGKPVENMTSKNHPLFVGENTLIPGFEDHLIGMKVGEKKNFPITFPKDYHHEPSAGKEFTFEVEVKKAEEPNLPEITPEFIKEVTGREQSVEEFKKNIKEDVRVQKEREQRQQRENELLEKLVKEAKLEVPPSLLQEEIEYLMYDLQQMLQQKGIDMQKYEEHVQKKGRNLKKEYEEEADKRIRVRLVLHQLFEELNISATEEEITQAVESYMQSVPQEHREQEQKALSQKQGRYAQIVNNIKLDKVFAKFLE
ncbi:trigger factor [Candidatus Peregrinibacteria bacterium CG11_big_fil_rev_8_21_14_0_20_46_8]|nr:MAG: trigger factor [Candidatus Peregrinibacteria bacterium CG11_big_fil_rev_8_21_14_0_20_46_8]